MTPPATRTRAALTGAICVALGGAALGAAPALAQLDWTDLFMNEQKELQIAEAEHPKVLAQFGGAYEDPALQAYLDGMIRFLGGNSNRPDIAYRVTILNSPIVNAFALPAGYIYVSRGLLALAGNEAELAGVLAHEIGHVTARHTAQRYGRGVLASIGIGGIGILGAILDAPQLAHDLQRAAGVGATLYIRGFSRDQELESDRLGVEIMARSGYDPFAMSSFLTRLQGDSRLRATLNGTPDGQVDRTSLLSTHPRTGERVVQAIEMAHMTPGGRALRAEDYLRRLDGLMYGDDPEQGLVRGSRFIHPALGFRFQVPAGFRLMNASDVVTAVGPEDAVIRFDRAPRPFDGAMADYLTQEWMKDQPLDHLETLDVGGLEAATGAARLTSKQGTEVDLRVVAIRFDDRAIYRFLFATPPPLTESLEMRLRGTTYSFARLDAAAADYRPHRIRILRAGPGDTAARLAARMPYDAYRVERFAALNGLDPAQPLPPGQLLKVVVEDR